MERTLQALGFQWSLYELTLGPAATAALGAQDTKINRVLLGSKAWKFSEGLFLALPAPGAEDLQAAGAQAKGRQLQQITWAASARKPLCRQANTYLSGLS